MKTILAAFTTLGAGLIAIGCGASAGGSGNGPGLGQTQQPLEALVPLASCSEVDTYVRDRIKSEINTYFDEVIKNINKSEYGGCLYRGGYGAEDAANSGGPPPAPTAPGSSSSSSGSSGTGGTGSKAGQSSGTNNQTAGVDEADFVKNDGQYLYVVANKALRIVKAWPANEMASVSKIALEGEPRKLFVEGDRAVVYVAIKKQTTGSGEGDYGKGGMPYPGGQNRECTYGYECVPSGDGTATKVLVFDISNRADPKKIRELDISGSLLAARRIGNAVHTVVVDPPAQIKGLSWYPENLNCNGSDDVASQKAAAIIAYEELRAQNLAAVAATDLSSTLPSVTENGASAVGACGGYYRPSLAEGRSFTSLVSVDITGGPLTTATVVSDPGVVYASETGLYMSVPHTQSEGGSWYDGMASEKQASTVHKFRIGATPSLTGYEASGIVKGRVLNQFALDEHDQHLRVATTTGHAPSPETHSTMNILKRNGSKLELTGKVDKIAPSEDIRSVRFDGSRGFIVTFKKTDPLYVFDLGNPSAPSITGELKIPGFSTYMHMMDAQHLLTIGYDASDQGSFAWFTGVMLQIFDVSDMKNPKLSHKEVIGTRGSSSEALTNHLAFTYFAPKSVLALPMTICEGGSQNGGYGTNMTFSGLMVYDTTATGGFKLKGKVAHPMTSTGGYDSAACSNWWTNASSEVRRSVVMDDFVYSISNKRVKVNAFANLGADIAEVSLEN
jgi:hypothetical protein